MAGGRLRSTLSLPARVSAHLTVNVRESHTPDKLGRYTKKQLKELERQLTTRVVDNESRAEDSNASLLPLLRPVSADSAEVQSPLAKGRQKHAEVVARLQSETNRPWFVLDPEGFARRMWDFLAAGLIYLLTFYIPVLIAYYDNPDTCVYFKTTAGRADGGVPGAYVSRGWQILWIFSNVFFVVDIGVNLVTGVERKDGTFAYWLPDIWRTYLITWFPIDLLACFPLECILQSALPHDNLYNLGKLNRLIRLVGLNRRCHGSPFRWLDNISNWRQEFSYNARRLATVVFILITLVHYSSCLIWWTVRLQDFPDVTWPVQLGVVHASVVQQWLWSVFCIVSAMIGLGYGPFPPRTWPEAFVWSFVMIAVATTFAVLNGFIFAAILHGVRGAAEYKKRMDNVLDVIHARKLPPAQRKRVLDFFDLKYHEHRYAKEDQVLGELPTDLQADIALHSTGALLEQVPLFAQEPELLQRVAMLLRPTVAVAGEVIQRQGWPARNMYFIRTGYVDLEVDGAAADTLRDGEAFGEAALLAVPPPDVLDRELGCPPRSVSRYATRFVSPATARALVSCDLYRLCGDEFQAVLADYPAAQARVAQLSLRYAALLCSRNAGRHGKLRFSPSIERSRQPSPEHERPPPKPPSRSASRAEPQQFRSISMPHGPTAAQVDGVALHRSPTE